MRRDKDIALDLYKQGLSYSQISQKLLVSKSTLSEWFKSDSITDEIKKTNRSKRHTASAANLTAVNFRRKAGLAVVYENARKEAELEFERYKNDSLFTAGICLYWGEGDKVSRNGFRVANSDPRLLKVFIQFLIKFCNAKKSRIRASILAYPDHDAIQIKEYWKSNLDLTEEDFTKTIFLKRRGKENVRKGSGVCIINYSDTVTKNKMMVWIDLMHRNLLV